MCEPLTLISLGLGAAQSAVSYMGANAQYKADQDRYRQNAINASRATEEQYKNLNIRAMQEEAATAQQKEMSAIEAAQAISTTQVAAAEGGVTGLGVDAILHDLYAQRGRNEATLSQNQRMSAAYLQSEKAVAEAGGQSNINALPIPERPSIAPYLIGAFGTGLNAYADYKKRKA